MCKFRQAKHYQKNATELGEGLQPAPDADLSVNKKFSFLCNECLKQIPYEARKLWFSDEGS